MNLRMIGLGAVVACATLLPLAALAGEAAGPGPGPGDDAKPRTDDAGRRAGGGLLPGLGLGAPESPPTPAPGTAPSAAVRAPSEAVGRASRCGPELASPDGIEAQTCVLTEGPDTWARTYYRNAAGRRLDSVLTLMAPGGRTVQVRCAVPARDEPGACETPRERSRGAASAYSAVAEFAGVGESGSAPLLLRSGSNMAAAGGS
ncbi:hypothetical protein M5362_31425 [Streptomyces sp. Je 1-79]|uniref:hypothetical protein n=1 Tax=Streptomyces sp. Je 1-79 TaxID=2943847 RepID=UPI0021A6796F|nr:hypothetical protein [Streptomyces sp. Je 1-79]MCT4357617.1 hypothetical protein [Streptomyces sp. Je 1-79]